MYSGQQVSDLRSCSLQGQILKRAFCEVSVWVWDPGQEMQRWYLKVFDLNISLIHQDHV